MKISLRLILLPLLLLLGDSTTHSAIPAKGNRADGQTVIREKLNIASGTIALDLDLNQLGAADAVATEARRDVFRFDSGPASFFTVLVFNNVLRGAEPGSISLSWAKSRSLPESLSASVDQLVLERTAPGADFELIVRDNQTGFVFFNIEGAVFNYDAASRALTIPEGRLLLSKEFAQKLGRPQDAGSVAGKISLAARMYPIEVTTLVNGGTQSVKLPARDQRTAAPSASAGPDIIVGDIGSLGGLAQFGSASGEVGLGVGTTSCNNGNVDFDFFQLPNPD
ncbi:MAG: hypothetical protein ABI992_06175, partial [Chthoniobacterales bacterium]